EPRVVDRERRLPRDACGLVKRRLRNGRTGTHRDDLQRCEYLRRGRNRDGGAGPAALEERRELRKLVRRQVKRLGQTEEALDRARAERLRPEEERAGRRLEPAR